MLSPKLVRRLDQQSLPPHAGCLLWRWARLMLAATVTDGAWSLAADATTSTPTRTLGIDRTPKRRYCVAYCDAAL
jgi:hypothetical protein